MDRVILHSDLNNFYASVECLHRPELRDKPVAVCGDAELRHGIVLAKNYIAKSYGIKTGDVIWEAKAKCPGLVTITADFPLYLRFSRLARQIYEDYTDTIESFGIDECWLDVTSSVKIFGSGKEIADRIRQRLREEIGITASVGVSWNKIFAKLGSDMKKPDATTVISRQNYKSLIYPLPASDLLYVGRATTAKLQRYNITTIGEIAEADLNFLKSKLGKWGEYLWVFANGLDASPVMKNGESPVVKSVGNSTTTVRDLYDIKDVRMIMTVLAESVARRMREYGLQGQVLHIGVQNADLEYWAKQRKLNRPTALSGVIIDAAMRLFEENYIFSKPIRNLSLKMSMLSPLDAPGQTDLFGDFERAQKAQKAEEAIDRIRERFGPFSITRATVALDKFLTGINPKDEHVIHPYSYFR